MSEEPFLSFTLRQLEITTSKTQPALPPPPSALKKLKEKAKRIILGFSHLMGAIGLPRDFVFVREKYSFVKHAPHGPQ